MNVALAKVESSRAVSEAFAGARSRLPGAGAVLERRQQALEAFEAVGIPHRRIEEWKYTDLRKHVTDVMPLAAVPDAAAIAAAKAVLAERSLADVRKIVLVDGAFVAELSDLDGLEQGLTIRSLSVALDSADAELQDQLFNMASKDAAVALNTAMMTDGVVIDIARLAEIARPINIVHVATTAKASSTFTRSLVRIGDAARVTLVESYIAADAASSYQTFDAAVLLVGRDANLQHLRLLEEGADAINVTSGYIKLGANSTYNGFGIAAQGFLSRYQAVIEMAGEGVSMSTNGVNMLNGKRHADTTLFVDHAVPNCMSREVFRAVVDDQAHSVFQGKIIVRPDAQQTDGKMMTRGLLLSDDATIDNKPELEIFADDVTCGHGAAVGALDDSLLFYLRARGLPDKEAQSLLILAFVGEAIESIENEAIREHVVEIATRWLDARK